LPSRHATNRPPARRDTAAARVTISANCLARDWGGIPKYVDRIVRELARDDSLEIELLANTSAPFTDVPGVRQAWRRVRGGVAWRHAFVLPRLLSRRPDVFWAPEGVMPVHVPVPSVLTVHDLAPLLFPGSKPARETLSFRTGVRRSARLATRVIAVSETTARDAERLLAVSRDRLCVIPNGVDDAFRPGDREQAKAVVRARWGVEAPFVLHVGSLEPRKGLEVLLDAAEAAAHAEDGWILVLAGRKGFRSEDIVRRAQEASWCKLLERVDDRDLVELYRAADVLAAPAHYEGFGITPLEAMACGTLVVIAGGSGGLEEISGSASVVVADRSAGAWRRAIAHARTRPAELIDRGMRLAGAYRWPEVATRTRAVLLDAAGRRTPKPQNQPDVRS
jgi:glycosyltransferase involved in cell wall biosynthesis